MSPEEKAKELLQKFSSVSDWIGGEGFISIGKNAGKKTALLAVNEIIEVLNNSDDAAVYEYWMQVKENIQTL